DRPSRGPGGLAGGGPAARGGEGGDGEAGRGQAGRGGQGLMEREELQKVFDQRCASGYDQQWSRMAPLRDALHLLIGAVLSELKADARILCVGAGTGPELIDLARRFPGWRFVAVEPSAPMLDICRRKAEEHGIADRCEF